jgi:arsenical pump membrane protein
MVGAVAHADGLFAAAGRRLERLPGGPAVLYGACLGLVAAVTAVLNLDTAVVFLTPVLILAARHRRIGEEPFLYAAVFMANASSLFLPGANLTNLIVLESEPISGGEFAGSIFLPATAACLATAIGLYALFGRGLGPGAPGDPPDGTQRAGLLGVSAVVAVAVLVVVLREPALPVLAVGLVAAGAMLMKGRLSGRALLDAVGPGALAALFAVAVALGVLAREWAVPGDLMQDAGRWQSAGIGALASVTVNNLPAAVLLSAEQIPHPRALLIGLNVGPNLAVTGSLSALLWFRAARQVGARPSALAFSRRGLLLAPAALVCALSVASLLATRA